MEVVCLGVEQTDGGADGFHTHRSTAAIEVAKGLTNGSIYNNEVVLDRRNSNGKTMDSKMLALPSTTGLFLVLVDRSHGTNVRQNLNSELIAISEELLGILADTYACWCTCKDNGSGQQSGALRQEADDLWYAEDEITKYKLA